MRSEAYFKSKKGFIFLYNTEKYYKNNIKSKKFFTHHTAIHGGRRAGSGRAG
jgi:hypothetical protein